MGVKVLSLDLSTSPGWAIMQNGALLDYGTEKFVIEDFNVNNYPNKSVKYPYNIIDTVEQVADYIYNIYKSENDIDFVLIENTVRGANRHTQRVLEFLHMSVLTRFNEERNKIKYIDVSEWRSRIGLYLSKEDSIHNKLVSKGEIRGRVTKKHLAVRYVNSKFNKNFKVKDNDLCDAICMGVAFSIDKK